MRFGLGRDNIVVFLTIYIVHIFRVEVQRFSYSPCVAECGHTVEHGYRLVLTDTVSSERRNAAVIFVHIAGHDTARFFVYYLREVSRDHIIFITVRLIRKWVGAFLKYGAEIVRSMNINDVMIFETFSCNGLLSFYLAVGRGNCTVYYTSAVKSQKTRFVRDTKHIIFPRVNTAAVYHFRSLC